jgi:hypothetical protein
VLALPLLAASGFDIPPVNVSLNVAGQPITIAISGNIAESTGDSMRFTLHAGLADLQAHLTPILKSELDRSDRCGERISIEDAVLRPSAPAASITVHLHVEKWACFKAFGKENTKRLLGGNALVEVKVTPNITEGKAIRLDTEIGKIDADGSLGELLRSGSLGDAFRDKIRESLIGSIVKATSLETLIPSQAQPYTELHSLSFAGDSTLEFNMEAQLQLSPEQAAIVLAQFRDRKKQ